MRIWLLLLIAAAAANIAPAAEKSSFEGKPAIALSNGKLELTILTTGGAMVSVKLRDDPAHMNPLWEPIRMAREAGDSNNTFGSSLGHFPCLDGFGGTSPEERRAGLPGHGEAHLEEYQVKDEGGAVVLSTLLPLVSERVTRTTRFAGDQVVSVRTVVESLLGFDRPMQWAEHATIGSPFLEPGVTVVNMSGHRAKTRPYQAATGGLPHRLASGQEFTWPMAPGLDGKPVNLTRTPDPPNSGDHATCLMDGELAWAAALNPSKNLVLGYVFRSAEFPWIQTWEFYPPNRKLARGIEFSTQAYDVPRREVVTENSLFGTPLYRWLPAKSKIESAFLMFYTRVPAGFSTVSHVSVESGRIVIEDQTKRLIQSLNFDPTALAR